MSFSRRSAASRLPLSRAIISRGPAWSPVSASSAPYWAKWLGHDSMFTFICVMTSMMGFGPTAAPEAPAGHRVLLAERVQDDGALLHAGQGDDGAAGAVEAHVEVGLVAQHQEVVGEGDVGEPLQLPGGALSRRGVVQVVQDEDARARRDAPLDRVDVDGVAVAGVDVPVGHGDAAHELDERAVDGEAGVGVEHLVAHVHGGHEELADHRLAARLHRHVVGGVGDAAGGADVGRQRLAQRRDAGVGAVRGLAVADGPLHGLDDRLGRGDVEVAQVERVDRPPLGGERGRLGRDGEDRLGAEPRDPVGRHEAAGRAAVRSSASECITGASERSASLGLVGPRA